MRVLHVGKYYPPHPGGIEYVLHDLLGAQRRMGMTAGAVVHHHQRGRATVREGDLWRVRTFGNLVYAPIAPSFPSVLKRAVKDFKPDVLHLHFPNTSALLVPDVPTVIQWHSDVVPSRIDTRLAMAYRLYKPFETRRLNRARAIVATSQRYLDSSQALKPFMDKCHVVPLGVEPQRLPAPSQALLQWAHTQWPAGKARVLAIGRLTYYKGYTFLIDALSRHEDLSLCIVGTGDLSLDIERDLQRFGVQERVNLLGYVDDDKALALRAACDCYCMSSIERTEAFGVVLIEAMRFGRPIVATDIPGSGVGFAVRDGVNGLLVPPADAQALGLALQRVRADAALGKRMGDAGARRFADEFHIDRVAEGFKRVYESI